MKGHELQPGGQSRVILYTTADGKVTVDVFFARDNFWLTQRAIAELFGVGEIRDSHLLESRQPAADS